jgi:hypothetical protein
MSFHTQQGLGADYKAEEQRAEGDQAARSRRVIPDKHMEAHRDS